MLHNFRVCFAAMTHFLIWPRNPKRLVYRHVIYFYKPRFFFFRWESKNEDLLCQRVLGSEEREEITVENPDKAPQFVPWRLKKEKKVVLYSELDVESWLTWKRMFFGEGLKKS